MIAYALLILFSIVAFELFVLLRMGRDAVLIITLSQESMRLLVSLDIDDDEKETFIRRASAGIFKATYRFMVKFLSIGLIAYLLFLLSVTLIPELRKAMLETLVTPAAIAILTVSVLCYTSVRKAIFARLRKEG